MLLKTKVRLAASVFLVLFPILWWYPSQAVWHDYQNLINKSPEVRLSLITLWVPIGLFGAVVASLFLSLTAIYTGKTASLVLGDKWMKIINKACVYSALSGVIFAVVFGFYSISLLDENGYSYSSALTKITPTGIHLIYLR